MPDSPAYYTPEEIAKIVGLTPQLVTRHLRAVYPQLEIKHHDWKQHWRLSSEQFETECAILKSAKLACPKQPLHALEVPQKFLVFG